MTTNTDTPSEHDEIEMLLPWYVTGKLDEAGRERVDAFLARYPEARQRLELSQAEYRETAFLNEPVPVPSEETVERFMAQLGARKPAVEPPIRSPQGTDTGRFEWIRQNLIEPLIHPGSMHWGAAAAALIILVQAVTIGVLVTSQDRGSVYQTASGHTQAVAPGTYADVRFADDARASDIAAVMAELNMTIAGGPKAGGFFVVRLGEKGMSSAEIAKQIAALKEKRSLVMLVTRAR